MVYGILFRSTRIAVYSLLNTLVLPPLTLYIHIPWCVRKCHYCDFNSYPIHGTLQEDRFITALLNDFNSHKLPIKKRVFNSIFIGGGTPSLISGIGITRLLTEITARSSFVLSAEITIEVNPGTINIDKLTAYKHAGINRLSIGIQSFNSKHLQTIGRLHNADEALQAIAIAKAAGFTNINLDLMFGLPNQTVQEAVNDIEQAINLHPQHISWYQLTLEPGTAFAKNPPLLPSETLLWKMHRQGQKLLARHNFIQYEVSAYARNDMRCQHNLNYWQFGDYLGIGPGAHSKITNVYGQITRVDKANNPEIYLTNSTSYNIHILSANDLIAEFMLNAMRLRNGFTLSLFEQRTGLKRSIIASALNAARIKNLIVINNDYVCTTALGYRFLNQLLLEF